MRFLRPLAIVCLLVQLRGVGRAATDPADWPVRRPGDEVAAPCWAGDVLTLRLRPASARMLVPRDARPLAAGTLRRTGLTSLDHAAEVTRATLAPLFAGEPAPAAGDPLDFTAFLRVQLPPGTSLETAEAAFARCPDVERVERIAILPVDAIPNDSLFSRQLWFNPANGPPRHDNHASEAWDRTIGDTTIVVGVIDTGMLPYHPELGGTDGGRGNRYINWSEASGLPGVDDDANGYVDDVSGWDFVHVPAAVVRAGEDKSDEDNDPNDFAGHGTMVAGVVGAIANNASGVAGTAWRVRLMPLRIGWSTTASPLGEIRMDFAAAAIRYATRMGANVVNCSWSSLNLSGIDLAISAATRAGTIVVVSSGNNGQVHYLGDRDDVIAVSAVDSTDVVPSFANRYPAVDLSAQGTLILSTALKQVGSDSLGLRAPAYAVLSGTSFAAPQVVGGVALLQSWRRALGRPPLTALGVLLRMRETTDDIAALNVGRPNYGTGRLNLERLLLDPPHSIVAPGGARTLGAPVVLHANVGGPRVHWVTSDAHLIAVDGATLDTLFDLVLPHAPTATLAAADLGGGLGIALAVGTSDGHVLVFRPDGTPFPGLPVAGLSAGSGPVDALTFADTDGDGVRSIAAASPEPRVIAWDPRNGAIDPGYPRAVGGPGQPGLAAGPLTGTLGASGHPIETLIVSAGDGAVHAFAAPGGELSGWPVMGDPSPRAPVLSLASNGGGRVPAVVVTAGATLRAFAADGAPLWNQALPGATSGDPALADIDGDGADESLLAYLSPPRLERRDSLGVEIARDGWPIAPAAFPSASLLAGALSPGGRMGVLTTVSGALAAWSDSGLALPAFPKPGGASGPAAIDDLDGDGATEVAAGTGSDSSLVVYEAGSATWSAIDRAWPTTRGDAARTGNGLGLRRALEWDRIRPARVTQLGGQALSAHALRVVLVATGDDSLTGRAYQRTIDLVPTNLPGIAQPIRDTREATAPGVRDTLELSGATLPEGAEYDVTVRVLDDQGNASAPSPVIRITLPVPVRATVGDLRVTATTDTTATLSWTPPGAALLDQAFRLAASRAPIDSADFDAAPVQLFVPAGGDPDPVRVAVIGGLTPGRRWYFAVRIEDGSGEPHGISNVVFANTRTGGVLTGRAGVALLPSANPTGRPVRFDWQGEGVDPAVRQTLAIHDLGGRHVRRFELGGNPGGTQTWDGRDEAGRLVPAGLYFARLTSGSVQATARVALLP